MGIVVNRPEIYKFKALYNIPAYYLYSKSVSEGFTNNEVNKISLKVTIYDVWTDHDLTDTENKVNILDYLMKKRNRKWFPNQ